MGAGARPVIEVLDTVTSAAALATPSLSTVRSVKPPGEVLVTLIGPRSLWALLAPTSTVERPPALSSVSCSPARVASAWRWRSEEHTSELQSLRHLVCRLLLEKKKEHNKQKHTE